MDLKEKAQQVTPYKNLKVGFLKTDFFFFSPIKAYNIQILQQPLNTSFSAKRDKDFYI